MKHVLGLLLGLLVSLSSVTAQAATVTLLPSVNPVIVGQTFSLAVRITDVFAGRAPDDEVIGFGFNIALAHSLVIDFVDATLAPSFLDAATSLEVSGIAFPDLLQDDPLLLATLTFQALAVGSTEISILSDLRDSNAGLVFFFPDPPSADITASIPITVTAVPEPATLWLLGTGFVVLLLAAQRRQTPVSG